METTVKAGHFVVLDKAKYATLHGYPAITQEMRLDPTSGHEASVSMMIRCREGPESHLHGDRSRISQFRAFQHPAIFGIIRA